MYGFILHFRPPTFKQSTAHSRTHARQLLLREQCMEQERREREATAARQAAAAARQASASSAVPIEKKDQQENSAHLPSTTVPAEVFKVLSFIIKCILCRIDVQFFKFRLIYCICYTRASNGYVVISLR